VARSPRKEALRVSAFSSHDPQQPWANAQGLHTSDRRTELRTRHILIEGLNHKSPLGDLRS
jgi:hypothetical protein